MTMKEYSAGIISSYLKKYNGNVNKAAEKLDIAKSKIYKMIKDKEISI